MKDHLSGLFEKMRTLTEKPFFLSSGAAVLPKLIVSWKCYGGSWWNGGFWCLEGAGGNGGTGGMKGAGGMVWKELV